MRIKDNVKSVYTQIIVLCEIFHISFLFIFKHFSMQIPFMYNIGSVIFYINAVCCAERILSRLYCTGAFGSIGVCYGDGAKWRIFVGFCLVFDFYGNICVF